MMKPSKPHVIENKLEVVVVAAVTAAAVVMIAVVMETVAGTGSAEGK